MATGFQRRCRKSNNQALALRANSGSEKRKLFRCLRFRDAQQASLSYSRGIRRTLRRARAEDSEAHALRNNPDRVPIANVLETLESGKSYGRYQTRDYAAP